jgi:uncharacterized Zn-binding protein involved in type VI secretion
MVDNAMGKPAARVTDNHVCPMVNPGPSPHVGGPVSQGSTNVFTGKLPQARVGDMAICMGPPDVIAMGSTGVFVNKKAAARMGDMTAHGGTIVAGLPTVLIGETAAGGGGGAAQLDGAAKLAFAQFEAQVQTLISAFAAGAPFCEVCFKNAQAELAAALKAKAAPSKTPSHTSTLTPLAGKPVQQIGPPAATVRAGSKLCEATSVTVSCSHGRRAGPEGLLMVVPGGAASPDVITGTISMKGGCGNHPAWTVSGADNRRGASGKVSFGASNITRLAKFLNFSPSTMPETATYHLDVQACSSDVRDVQVIAFPPDEIGIALDLAEDAKAIAAFLSKVCPLEQADSPQFLQGSASFTQKWREDPKTWHCFSETTISCGFNPLVGGQVHLPFAGGVPPPLSKYADISAFVLVYGAVNLNANLTFEFWPEMPEPRLVRKAASVTGGGELWAGVGAQVRVGSVIRVEVDGEVGTSIEVHPGEESEGDAVASWMAGAGRFNVTVELPAGIEFHASVEMWPGFTGEHNLSFRKQKA